MNESPKTEPVPDAAKDLKNSQAKEAEEKRIMEYVIKHMPPQPKVFPCYPCNACKSTVFGHEEGLKFANNKWYCFGCCQKQVDILVRENDLLDPCLLIEMGYREVTTMKPIDPPDPKYWENYRVKTEKPKTGNQITVNKSDGKRKRKRKPEEPDWAAELEKRNELGFI